MCVQTKSLSGRETISPDVPRALSHSGTQERSDPCRSIRNRAELTNSVWCAVSSFGKPEARTSEAPREINKQTKSFPATKLLLFFFVCFVMFWSSFRCFPAGAKASRCPWARPSKPLNASVGLLPFRVVTLHHRRCRLLKWTCVCAWGGCASVNNCRVDVPTRL